MQPNHMELRHWLAFTQTFLYCPRFVGREYCSIQAIFTDIKLSIKILSVVGTHSRSKLTSGRHHFIPLDIA